MKVVFYMEEGKMTGDFKQELKREKFRPQAITHHHPKKHLSYDKDKVSPAKFYHNGEKLSRSKICVKLGIHNVPRKENTSAV